MTALDQYADEDWEERLEMVRRYAHYGPDDDITENSTVTGGLVSLKDCRVRVAGLDRLLDSLSDGQRHFLIALGEGPLVNRGSALADLVLKGLMRWPETLTPLGRACLRRAAMRESR